MKNVREYYVACLASETPKFVNVLKAVPPDKADYKPHERSMSASDLIWLLTTELHDSCDLVDKGQAEWKPTTAPAVPDAIAQYEKHAAALGERAAKLDDAAWDKPVKFLVNGQVAWEATLGDMLFGFLFDAVHHRGQLSTYLRPMGAKVPSIYGPSGDDPGR